MAECRSCGKPITWVVVAKSGKKMPIDRDPVGDGNIVKTGEKDSTSGADLVAYERPGIPEQGDSVTLPMIGETIPGARARYKSHFATCPNAEEHRR